MQKQLIEALDKIAYNGTDGSIYIAGKIPYRWSSKHSYTHLPETVYLKTSTRDNINLVKELHKEGTKLSIIETILVTIGILGFTSMVGLAVYFEETQGIENHPYALLPGVIGFITMFIQIPISLKKKKEKEAKLKAILQTNGLTTKDEFLHNITPSQKLHYQEYEEIMAHIDKYPSSARKHMLRVQKYQEGYRRKISPEEADEMVRQGSPQIAIVFFIICISFPLIIVVAVEKGRFG